MNISSISNITSSSPATTNESKVDQLKAQIKELEAQLTQQKKSKSGSVLTPNCEIKILKTQ